MKTLEDMGEDAVVSYLIGMLNQGEGVVVGPGDDCAVVDVGQPDRFQLLKTDCLVEGVHFESREDPERVGWKAVARVVSDFAAMGGEPEHLLVTIALSPETELSYVESLYTGMQKCASQFHASLVGGETSAVPSGSAALISVAGTGSVEKSQLVTRAGGEVGDAVFVSGCLGGSIKGRHLDFVPRVEEVLWLTQHFNVHAMMDLSDGVARDLPRLAAASECGYRIDRNAVPVTDGCNVSQALGDGEDYELMFAVAAEDVQSLFESWSKIFPDTPLSKIGSLCEQGEGQCFENGGWQHFEL